jgi:16S rRNA (guanine966-N2)-methyltransferase
MKDRVREAVFNLVGPAIKGMLAIDLFSGTGAMALEAISRGAADAIAVDRHFPSVKGIEENAKALGVEAQVRAVAANVFTWMSRQQLDPERPVVVFVCPPYEFFVSATADLMTLVEDLLQRSPAGSLVVLESDERFDTQQLVDYERWDIRVYPPAVISITQVDPLVDSVNRE